MCFLQTSCLKKGCRYLAVLLRLSLSQHQNVYLDLRRESSAVLQLVAVFLHKGRRIGFTGLLWPWVCLFSEVGGPYPQNTAKTHRSQRGHVFLLFFWGGGGGKPHRKNMILSSHKQLGVSFRGATLWCFFLFLLRGDQQKTRQFSLESPKEDQAIGVWLKIKPEGQTAGFGPCFHLPGWLPGLILVPVF